MLKIFYPETLKLGSIIHLKDEEAHHLFHVLRAARGEKIIILNGKGCYAEGHILDHKKQKIEIDHVHFVKKNEITLYPSLLKNRAMDFLIRETAAIGVAEIIPLVAERSEVKIDSEIAEKKQLHWSNIAREACKQSGNPNLPYIKLPQKMEQINFNKPTFIAALQKSSANIFIHENIIQNYGINLVIGPEGDFSEKEYQYFSQKNAYFVHLGKNVLRSETAALYFLSVIDHLISL